MSFISNHANYLNIQKNFSFGKYAEFLAIRSLQSYVHAIKHKCHDEKN